MGNPRKNTVTTSEEFKTLVRHTQNLWENERNEGLDLSFRRSKTEQKKNRKKEYTNATPQDREALLENGASFNFQSFESWV